MSSNTQGKSDDLQFDRVETTPGQAAPERLGPAVTCTVCSRSIDTQYWQANGKPVCNVCRQRVQAEATSPKGAGPLLKAGLFGLGAAIAGAAIYYAVMALADLEIGIVAILIGFMVGYAVRKGAAGRGGKRFQIIAAVLTYWAVGLAYTPFALKGLVEGKSAKVTASAPADSSGARSTATPDSASATATDSLSAPAADTTPTKAAASKNAEPVSAKTFVAAIGIMLLLVFALPVTAIVGTMPSGLISALIIFFGLRQAWRMTGAPELNITGPYKVGVGPAGATS
jgi:hypothetical protein